MSRRVNFNLNEPKLAELEQAINYSPHAEVRQLAIAIRLLGMGHYPEEVAKMVMVKAITAWAWHRRWQKGGVKGLQDEPGAKRASGRAMAGAEAR